MTTERPLPSEEEVRGYTEICSNWGRWGADDERGTVNLITDAKRMQAAKAIRSGRAVSCAYAWNKLGGAGNPNPAMHYLRFTEGTSADFLGIFYHGYATTHLDSLCHVFHEGKMYNGIPSELAVNPWGAKRGGVQNFVTGLTTRGVLVDIPRFRGTEHITLESPVRGWEIEAAAEKEGVSIEPGDALLVYSGRPAYEKAHREWQPGSRPTPGLHADCAPVLKRKDVALLCWDFLDASPCGYDLYDQMPIHALAMVYIGLPLLDNALIEPLAAVCAEAGQYDFQFTVNPLHVRGATGSPVNPIAIL